MNIRPQLVIVSKLLQVAGSELEQFINTELADNPALELANEPDLIKAKRQLGISGRQSSSYSATFSTVGPNHPSSFEEIVENIAQRRSPLERLVEQVSLILDKTDRDIAVYLLHCLDYRGYLVIPMQELAYELDVSKDTIERVTQVLQELEPPGIGARDIRECFLIQCAHLEAEGADCEQVRRILTVAWDDFLNQKWDRVARKLQKPKRLIEETCEFIRRNFYPHPLAMLETSTETNENLNYADLIVLRDKRANPPVYSLEIPGADEFELKISASFQTLLGSATQNELGLSAQEKTWMKIHMHRALVVIGALRQRWETLRQIGEYLIQHQNDFLEHGTLYLKPLTRAVVAQELNVHESTISRAVSDKTIQLPNGHLIPLSDFFDPSLAAKEAIRLLLRNNSKRLCDREITEGLRAKGITLSRRTVTKYRREINISSSRQQSIVL